MQILLDKIQNSLNHKEYTQEQKQAKFEIMKDFLEFMTNYHHDFRKGENWNVFSINKEQKYFEYEPYIDNDDAYNIQCQLPNMEQAVKSGISEVKDVLINAKLNGKMATVSDIMSASKSIINETIDYIGGLYDYISLETMTENYLEKWEQYTEINNDRKLTKVEVIKQEFLKYYLNDNNSFIDDFTNLSGLESEIHFNTNEIEKIIKNTEFDSLLSIITPDEYNSDLINLENTMKDLNLCKLLSSSLDNFHSNQEEAIKIRNEYVQELIYNIFLMDNGLTHLLVQHGLTLDVIADYEKLCSFKQERPDVAHFISNLIDDDNESLDLSMNMSGLIKINYEEAVVLNVLRVIANAANNTHYYQYIDEWKKIEQNDNENINPMKLIEYIPNEIKYGGLKFQIKDFGAFSPNEGANGWFCMNHINLEIPFTSLYVDKIGETPQIGHYSPEIENEYATKIRPITNDKFNSDIIIQLDPSRVDSDMTLTQAFQNGVTYDSLNNICEKKYKIHSRTN